MLGLCRPRSRAFGFLFINPQLALWATDMPPAPPAANCITTEQSRPKSERSSTYHQPAWVDDYPADSIAVTSDMPKIPHTPLFSKKAAFFCQAIDSPWSTSF
jgi:hypothetical protein